MKRLLTLFFFSFTLGVAFAQPPAAVTVAQGAPYTLTAQTSTCYSGNCTSCPNTGIPDAFYHQYGFRVGVTDFFPDLAVLDPYWEVEELNRTESTTGVVNYPYRRRSVQKSWFAPFSCDHFELVGSRTTVFTIAVTVEPSLTFTPPATICQNAASINLLSSTNKTSGTLSTTFTNVTTSAVIPGGVFNPALLAPGTYTIRADYPFYSGMESVNATITVNPLPNLTSTLPTNACANGADINLTSAFPVTGGTNVYTCVGGTCNPSMFYTVGPNTFLDLDFLGTSTTFNSTIRATATSPQGCVVSLDRTITINANPSTFTVAGGGAFCSGGAGVAVTLPGSQAGVSYQLRRDGTNTGSPVNGTGGSISFGNQTVAGAYTVVATTAAGCSLIMTGSVNVVVNPLPAQYAVTGGGAFCSGGAGVAVGLADTDTGVSYQLRLAGVPTGSPVNGTGAAISFGNQTAAGNYTVLATITATGCTQVMTGSVNVTVNPLPAQFTVSGGGSVCSGGPGVTITLGGSETGVNYQLFKDGVADGAVLGGTGTNLQWTRTITGNYTVTATSTASPPCLRPMLGSAAITAAPPLSAPSVSISPSGPVCSSSAFTLTASGLASGAEYRWFNPSGTQVQASTSPNYTTPVLTVGSYTYRIKQVHLTTACESPLQDIVLTVNTPGTVNFTTPSLNQCTATSGTINLLTSLGASPAGGTFSSTSGVISSRLSGANNATLSLAGITPGSYTVTYAVGGACAASGNATITFVAGAAVPTVADVKICEPGITTLAVSSPDPLLQYEWYSAPTGGSLISSGTSFATPFLTVNTTYYIEAVNTATSCRTARDAALVTVVNIGPVTAGPDIGFCNNIVTVNLLPDASPAGGVFTGPGVTGSTFVGNALPNNNDYTVRYTVTVNGCAKFDERVISLGFNANLTFVPNDSVDMGELITIKHNYANATTTNWNFGDGWTMSALEGKHYYYLPGPKDITVFIQLPAGCSNTFVFDDAVFVKGELTVITDIVRESGAELVAYPNPFNGELKLHSEAYREGSLAELLDPTGRVVKTSVKVDKGETVLIDEGESLPAGMYLVRVKHENSVQFIKLIKQ